MQLPADYAIRLLSGMQGRTVQSERKSSQPVEKINYDGSKTIRFTGLDQLMSVLPKKSDVIK